MKFQNGKIDIFSREQLKSKLRVAASVKIPEIPDDSFSRGTRKSENLSQTDKSILLGVKIKRSTQQKQNPLDEMVLTARAFV